MGILDASRLANLRRDIGEDGVREVAEVLFREVPKRIDEMRRAQSAGDRATLERAAHSLKSNARLFGASELGEHCKRLEESSQAQIPPDAARRIDEIAGLWAQAEPQIRSALAALKG